MIDSPFFSIKYGFPIGSSGWGLPMDENLLVLSFLVKGSVNEIVTNAPPSESSGYSVFSTSDNLFYVYANGSSVFVEPVVGMEFNVLSNNTRWRWNGTSLEEIATNDNINDTVQTLNGAFVLLVGRVEDLESSVSDIVTNAGSIEVTSDSITQTLSAWMEYVRDRDNHTGTQPASTISDFEEAVGFALSNLFNSQTIDIQYEPLGNTFTFEVINDKGAAVPSSSGVLDLSGVEGSVAVDLSENITSVVLPPSSVTTTRRITLRFEQDDTTPYTVSGWSVDGGGDIIWLEGVAPTISPTLESITQIDLISIDGGSWFGVNTSNTTTLANSAIQSEDLGSAAFEDTSAFDSAGAASAAQAFSIQRINHTGTQPASTISGLAAIATSGNASDAAITDAGSYYASGDVEGALQEVGSILGGKAPRFTPVADYSSTGRDLALSDASTFIRASNGADITFTIQPESTVSWAPNTEIYFQQAGIGQIVFATGSGVTIEVSPAFELKTKELMAVVCLKKVGTDVWTLFGSLELV